MIDRLIAAAARDRLRPLGLQQKGRSRLWIADEGWYLILVEFQSGSGPGSYLNVGAMWLWAERGHWAFDEGYRMYWREQDGSSTYRPPLGEPGWTQHVRFLNAGQFAADISQTAAVAAGQVAKLREEFKHPRAVVKRLASTAARPGEDPLWHAFHGGVAAACIGDTVTAERYLKDVVSAEITHEWQHALASRAATLRGLLEQPDQLHDILQKMINEGRQLLGLPETKWSEDW
ncbi:hypothetical protein Acsp01_90310 [Actinoplanes sp. NBRC 101535]|nr:hypothetical protein Acsp01_90310 [Actinoplanes sp. NBRC 101535]